MSRAATPLRSLWTLTLCASTWAQPADWAPMDTAVRAQLDAAGLPGAVLIVGDAHHVWLRRAWGQRAHSPQAEPMTPDTVFDLASLTKVLCTTTAVLQLAERGRLELDDPVARHWPAFGQHGKAAITVRQLLSHSGGLPAGLPAGRAPLDALLALAPAAPPGSTRTYSDAGFIALGELVQRVSRLPLDDYCRLRVFQPLGLHALGFRPPPGVRARIAPTEPAGDRPRRGQVQDPTARRLNGVAGHAGLFGSADDLARFAQALLRAQRGESKVPLHAGSLAALQRPQGPTGSADWYGLGWHLHAPLAAGRDALPPLGTIGHTGYTGTGLWIDLVQQRFVVLLTSRLHGAATDRAATDGAAPGDARPLRRQVLALLAGLQAPLDTSRLLAHDASFARWIDQPPPLPRATAVASGIDVLHADRYAALAGRRIALLTHAAAIDRDGWRTLDRLRWAPGVTLVRVFTPEHGLQADAEGRVPSRPDPWTGLPLHSLYGERRRPAAADLQGIQTLVVDLQDAGARFYTYAATLRETLRAAADAGVDVMVLDRPNPARADRVGGPMLDAGRRSFTAPTEMPVQHGMTLGELARYFAAELRDEGWEVPEPTVIAMRGYRREAWFDQTGLDWVAPSPNLRRPPAALLYPGVAWVEGANVSVGRGTAQPFERLGAPWLDGTRLAEALRAQELPGLDVRPVEFVPVAAPFAGQTCSGVALRVTDRERFDAQRLGAALVRALWRAAPDQFRIERTLGNVGSAAALAALQQEQPLDDLIAGWADDRAAFMRRRAAALLY
jgi:uncharacterized protein YbbC (DUF1343 family)/CubicO group peptidase (beta-lactamase class C family)